MTRWWWRLRALFRGRRLENELDDEVTAHLESAVADYLAEGMTPAQAALAARRAFGGIARMKEAHRDGLGFRAIDTALRDARFALRGMRRTPAFTAVALTILSLAIGANTAIVSIVNELLIKPLPYHDAERLVAIEATRQYEGRPRPGRVSWSLAAVDQWRESLHTFDAVTSYSEQSFQLDRPAGADLLEGAIVAPSFFDVLGGPIAVGRPFAPADVPGPAVVISDRLARRLFTESNDAIGRHLTLNGRDYLVAAVTSPRWSLPTRHTDVWESATFAHARDARCCAMQLLGRLAPNVSVMQARGDVSETARMLAAADAVAFGRAHTTVSPLRDQQLGDGRQALLLLWASVAIVLVLACANIANLLVARNLARTREFTLRQALGASRGRLLLQGIVESTMLSAGGVAGGLLVAWLARGAWSRVNADVFPVVHDGSLDPATLFVAVALGAVTALATGVAPSLHATRATSRTIVNAPTRGQRHLQRALCVSQLCAAVVLLIAATLLGRGLIGLLGVDMGVTADRVVTASLNAAIGRDHSSQEIASVMRRAVDRVRHLPGVQAAGLGTSLPPNTSRMVMSLKRNVGDQDSYLASSVSCTPGYFEALGIRLLKGRFFTDADDAQHPPVLIVGVSTARRLFGTEDPIGQTFTVPSFRFRLTTAKDATVVGVVSDVKYSGLEANAGDQVYWAFAQAPWQAPFLAVRALNGVDVSFDLRRAVAEADPSVAVSAISSLDAIVDTQTAPARFRTGLVLLFALTGLAIAGTGLYGVMSQFVSQRTTDIGVRMAIGAQSTDVVRLVLRESLGIAATGVLIGVPLAYAAARVFAALLYAVTPGDPATYVLSAVVLVGVALVASYVPGRRAATLDPIVALRSE